MKLKFYLRGLGIGILVTALILTVSNNVRAGKEGTDDNVKPSDSIINYTQPQTENSSQKETASETESKKESETVKQTETATEKTTLKQTTAAQPTATAAANNGEIKVTLSNITYSGKAAEILAGAGVVDDKDAFNKYLMEHGYSTKILDGTYSFSKGQDYESVAKAITRK